MFQRVELHIEENRSAIVTELFCRTVREHIPPVYLERVFEIALGHSKSSYRMQLSQSVGSHAGNFQTR